VIHKEFRALLPAWAACAVTMLAASAVDGLRGFGGPAYPVGVAALGAMAIGHEYSHRTMGLLLSLPVSRLRLLLTKLGVLAVMLGGLMIVAWTTIPATRMHTLFSVAFFWLPALTALFVAPWLTMLSRSPVGGAVFTLSLGGILLVVGEWIGVARYGYTREVDAFRLLFLWWSVAVLCATGAVMTWWTFARLQTIDGRGTELHFTPRTGAIGRGLTRHNPGWLLVKKELRLQQLALALAGCYALGHAIAAFSSISPPWLEDTTTIMTLLPAGLLAILIGSMASAEERHWRTLDSQLLLPMGSSRQWHIKVMVVLGLTSALALGLPATLFRLLPVDPQIASQAARQLYAPGTVIVLAALTVLSLYVSTLCSSGMWALILSLPAAALMTVLVLTLGDTMGGILNSLGRPPDWPVVQRTAAVLALAVMAVVLRLALTNHRSADRSPWRTVTQVGILAGAVVGAVTLVGLAGALSR
jgi:ABC-type transport system involved in multi-copper enzyme maturation permease subunit